MSKTEPLVIVPGIPDEDVRHLRRFKDICDDADAGGHDLPKEVVKRLEQSGALRNCGFGRHEITAFGEALVGAGKIERNDPTRESGAQQMVSVKREQLEKWQKEALEWKVDSIGVGIMHVLSQPAEQHQDEPLGKLMRDKYQNIVIVPIGDPHITDGMLVYASADAGEVARLRCEVSKWRGTAGRVTHERDSLRSELAIRDALLNEVIGDVHFVIASDTRARIEAVLSSSAEPEVKS